MNKRDLGFQKENIIVLNIPYDGVRSKVDMIKQELLSLPEVKNVTASSAVPIRGFTSNGYFPEGFKSPMMINVVDVDEDFFDVWLQFDVALNTFVENLHTHPPTCRWHIDNQVFLSCNLAGKAIPLMYFGAGQVNVIEG